MKLLFLLLSIMQIHFKPVERQVLLFYTNLGKEMWEKQKGELNRREPGTKERDILIKSFQIGLANDGLLRDWNVDSAKDFTFILVGRDGGEKFRSNGFVTADKLFALIDAMPMRQHEQRRSERKP